MGVGYGRLWNVVRVGSPFSNLRVDGQGVFCHTGVGIHTTPVPPAQKRVYVCRYETGGDFTDPDDAALQLVDMIMNARLAK